MNCYYKQDWKDTGQKMTYDVSVYNARTKMISNEST